MIRFWVAVLVVMMILVGCGARNNIILESDHDGARIPVAELRVRVVDVNYNAVRGAVVGFSLIQCESDNHDWYFRNSIAYVREMTTLGDGTAKYAYEQMYQSKFYIHYIRIGNIIVLGEKPLNRPSWPPLAMSEIVDAGVAEITVDIPMEIVR